MFCPYYLALLLADGYDPAMLMDGHLTPEYIDENGVHG